MKHDEHMCWVVMEFGRESGEQNAVGVTDNADLALEEFIPDEAEYVGANRWESGDHIYLIRKQKFLTTNGYHG